MASSAFRCLVGVVALVLGAMVAIDGELALPLSVLRSILALAMLIVGSHLVASGLDGWHEPATSRGNRQVRNKSRA